MLEVGMIIDDRYKILQSIGRGGTSQVFLAENIRLKNYWAIKEVYKNSFAANGAGTNFLVAESHILTKLRHPGLPAIVDIMATEQSYLIVMEYIEGVSLDKILTERGAQAEKNVIKWGIQLCDVLDYLHTQNPPIIYRDMKPANIMLKPDGDVVLIDFGMAREFKNYSQHDTTNLGTHGYAAPEQYGGYGQTDPRSDVYSLGVTLYHLVTGHDPCLPPYGIRPITTINPSLSLKLEQIISKCTQLKAEERYQNIRDLKNNLCSQVQKFDVPSENKSNQTSNNNMIWLLILIPVFVLIVSLIIIVVVRQEIKKREYEEWLSSYEIADDYENDYDLETVPTQSVVTPKPAVENTPTPSPNPTVKPTENMDYILPRSDTKYLTMSDLNGLNADYCRLARNEIYARHGRKFEDKVLQEYFNSKPWYRPIIEPEDFREDMLNVYEQANRDLIIKYEKEQGFR